MQATVKGVRYRQRAPTNWLTSLIDHFWMVENTTGDRQTFDILPDGSFDIVVECAANRAVQTSVYGIYTKPFLCRVEPHQLLLAVALKPSAIEVLRDLDLAGVANSWRSLETDYLGGEFPGGSDLERFSRDLEQKWTLRFSPMKVTGCSKLFEQIDRHGGVLKIRAIADEIGWSERSMNRFFRAKLGLSLKAYLSIVKVRRTFQALQEGELNGGSGFFDQSHYIHEIRGKTGRTPKELAQNKNDRFLQLTKSR